MPLAGPRVPPQGRNADRNSRILQSQAPRRYAGTHADDQGLGKSPRTHRTQPARSRLGSLLGAESEMASSLQVATRCCPFNHGYWTVTSKVPVYTPSTWPAATLRVAPT